MDIRIDPEFQSFIPHLSDEESAQLEANIIAEGCRDPLVVWQEEQILLDGHNRLRICQAHDLPYQVREVSFSDRIAAAIWIINQQLGRRNLTANQNSDLRGQRYKFERLREGSAAPEGNQYAVKTELHFVTQFLELENDEQSHPTPAPGDTAQRIADETGVNRLTIFRDAEFSEALDTLSKDVSPTMRQTMTAPTPKEKKPRRPSPDAPKPFRATKQAIVETARTVKEQQIQLLPFMKRGHWTDFQALEAMSLLGAIPKTEHAAINTLLDEEGIPVDVALAILKNLKALVYERRQTIYTLHASSDPREVSLAKTMAAALPPSPDPQVLRATAISRALTEQKAAIGKWIRDWPMEPWINDLLVCETTLHRVIDGIESVRQQAKQAHNQRTERYGETTVTF